MAVMNAIRNIEKNSKVGSGKYEYTRTINWAKKYNKTVEQVATQYITSDEVKNELLNDLK